MQILKEENQTGDLRARNSKTKLLVVQNNPIFGSFGQFLAKNSNFEAIFLFFQQDARIENLSQPFEFWKIKKKL